MHADRENGHGGPRELGAEVAMAANQLKSRLQNERLLKKSTIIEARGRSQPAQKEGEEVVSLIRN